MKIFPHNFLSKTVLAIGFSAGGAIALVIASNGSGQPAAAPPSPSLFPAPSSPAAPLQTGKTNDRSTTSLPWRLNNPAPNLIPESRANPGPVADKFASRAHSIEQRALLRAYEGAPPVIPHAIDDVNVQTCRACHGIGIKTGNKIARMAPHTQLTNCTQCHVEAAGTLLGSDPGPQNTFVGLRSSGYGGTRASAGAPPVIPHSTFMRINCVSCHGEYGYDGWRPDHLSRTNCVQCHAPAAEFDQLAPTFGIPDLPDGTAAQPPQ